MRHFTVSIIIIHQNKTLLHLHKKLGVWLPVGGHIHENELPEDAARREAQEEAGLKIQLLNSEPLLALTDAKELIQPAHIILEDIEPGHQHIDLVYYATSKTDKLDPQEGEAKEIKWVDAEELKTMDNIPQNARVLALEALNILSWPK